MPDNYQAKINEILKFRTGIIHENYNQIKDEYEKHYNLPEIDPLRNEICLCIMFGFYQSVITLSNHLFEKAFKLFLIVHYSKKTGEQKEDEERGIVKQIISVFKPSHSELGNKKLSYIINKSYSEGIITKEHKKTLYDFRVNFRNAYSHADAEKTFGNSKVSVSGLSVDKNKIS